MRLRYTLNNTTEGEHVCAYSPKGWEEMELVLKRHEKYDGIFKDYTVKAEFFCGAGKEYIDNIYDTQGIEAEVTALIEIDCTDSGTYEELYDGKLIMKSYEKIQAAPEYTRVNLEQAGIIQTVLNRLEVKVDLSSLESLDGTALTAFNFGPYELTMHSKELLFVSTFIQDPDRLTLNAGVGVGTGDQYAYPLLIQIGELEESLDPVAFDPGADYPIFYAGDSYPTGVTLRTIAVSGNLRFTITWYDIVVRLYLRATDSAGAYLETQELDTFLLDEINPQTEIVNITFSHSLDVPEGGNIFLYFEVTGEGSGGVNSLNIAFDTASTLTLSEESEYPASIANAWTVFEAGAQISRTITNQLDSFRSNYFGRINSQPLAYDANGCGSFEAITNGFQIRGFPIVDTTINDSEISGKPVVMSMQEYFEGLSAIHCLGLGVKQEGDNTYIEIEPKDFFFTEEVLFSISNINKLTTKIEQKFFYNIAKVGYREWRKEGTNGLDEFCATREYSTLHKTISQTLDATSSLIAAPYAIERQRREQYVDTYTKDEEYDNNNFIICLNRTVDGSGIPTSLTVAEKNENFTDVENVFSPTTIYNLRISPARNIRNWIKILATGVIKLNSILKDVKFSFGEGNTKMTSKGVGACDTAENALIEEGDDLVLTLPASNSEYEPLFTGEVDDFEAPLSLSQYMELKELDADGNPNYYKQIQYSTTTEDYLAGYIIELRYKPVRGNASFKMARAYNRSEVCTHIYVVEGYVECDYVE
jgi:hypothetical protein